MGGAWTHSEAADSAHSILLAQTSRVPTIRKARRARGTDFEYKVLTEDDGIAMWLPEQVVIHGVVADERVLVKTIGFMVPLPHSINLATGPMRAGSSQRIHSMSRTMFVGDSKVDDTRHSASENVEW